MRYSVNAGGGSNDLNKPLRDVANATPYLFDELGLHDAITGMRELAR